MGSAPKLLKKEKAQGRLGQRRPIAIIDIGSNSVRQVVYEGLTRAPSVLFNEKVLCGLGKGVAKDGSLEQEAVASAITAIKRFMMIGRQLGVEDTHVLATAAAREADNGKKFIEKVASIVGVKPSLLSGKEEAQLASFGIQSGFFRPDGIAGDQGGGSTELVPVGGDFKNGATTPLGALRLQELSGDDASVALKIARKVLKDYLIEWPSSSREFYAIGGTWRSLARLHMLENDYPLDVIHGYRVKAGKYLDFCKRVIETPLDKFANIDELSKNRRLLLPYGAAVMTAIMEL